MGPMEIFLGDLLGEIWKSVLDYEGFYEVSNKGRIKSLPRVIERSNGGYLTKTYILVGSMRKNGLYVGLHKSIEPGVRKAVAHLVLEAFVGPKPNGKEALHYPDPSHYNNCVENVRWGTRSENEQDKRDNGTYNKRWKKPGIGEKNHNSKLTELDVKEIRQHYRTVTFSILELAHRYNVCDLTIKQIIERKTWKHI